VPLLPPLLLLPLPLLLPKNKNSQKHSFIAKPASIDAGFLLTKTDI
jgi:hypothetical protein